MRDIDLHSSCAHGPVSKAPSAHTFGSDGISGISERTVSYSENTPIHARFAAQVRRTPNSVAAIFENQRLTYIQLDQLSSQLAHELIAHGVKPDDRVGIYLERSMMMLIAMLATLKAGAGYVPLDPSYPPERLAFMVRDSSPRAILTQAELAHQLEELGIPIVLLDREILQPNQCPTIVGLTSRHLAYVIYTSGSTGQPKGVMVEHRGILRLVTNSRIAISRDDCVAHCASPSFDATTWEVWAPLLNGARVVIIPQRIVLEPYALNKALIEHQVTAIWLTVGLFNEYMDELEEAFSGLRYVVTGGDVLNPATVASVISKTNRPRHLINAYGPTETTTFATMYEISTTENRVATSIPIGRAIQNTDVYILDAKQRQLPTGEAGEIYIGGPGVARGYMNHPALTSERFVASAFGGCSGERLYRSGDIGCWQPDGNIAFLGRRDSQVKIRGFRIELGEVEAALQSYPMVRQAIAVAHSEHSGLKRLLGYVELRVAIPDNKQLTSVLVGLREHLTARLPSHMVPAAIIPLYSFPLTANGKVDRRRLPAPERDTFLIQDHAPPRTDSEFILTQIWQDILAVGRIGIDDDFFALGGDSISTIRLTSAMSHRLGIPISSTALLRNPTIRQFSDWLATPDEEPPRLAGSRTDVLVPVSATKTTVAISRKNVAPLSIQQKSFLDFSQRCDHWTFWCTTELRLRGILNLDLLRESLNIVVNRHEALRTTFLFQDGETMQQINESGMFGLETHEFSNLSNPELSHETQLHIDRFLTARVDPAVGPLLRIDLLRFAAQDHVLLVAIHHLVIDGLSFAQVFQELWRCYDSMLQGHSPALPEASMQYVEYTAWQRSTQISIATKLRRFWAEKLTGSTPVRMPVDSRAHDPTALDMCEMTIDLDERLSSALYELGRSERTMPALIIIAVYSGLVAAWCGQRDFILLLAVSGRVHSEHATVLGLVASGLPLRVKLAENASFVDLLRLVVGEYLQACEHLDFGLHSLKPHPELSKATSISWVGDAAEAAGVPAPSFWNEQRTHLSIEPLRVRSMRTEDGIPPHFRFSPEIMWRFQSTNRGIRGHVYYDSRLFSHDYIAEFVNSLRSLCEHVTRDRYSPLTQFKCAQQC